MYDVDFDYKKIFKRNLSEMGKYALTEYNNSEINFMSTDNPQIEYRQNKLGYRGPDFNGSAEILTLGCSQTFGHGMPEEYIWPNVLSKKMNMIYSNLAIGGDGIQAQVIKAFQYFKEFGNPKFIFGVFPLTRMEMPYVKNKFGKDGPSWDSYEKQNIDKKFIQQVFIDEIDFDFFSKCPHNPHKVLPVEVAIFYNLMFIKMLEQYCELAGIKFLWSVYDESVKGIDLGDITGSKCYFTDPCFYWWQQSNQPGLDKISLKFFNEEKKDIDTFNCHQEYKNNVLFDVAADYMYSTTTHRQGHWGIHKHLHVAEKIYGIINS